MLGVKCRLWLLGVQNPYWMYTNCGHPQCLPGRKRFHISEESFSAGTRDTFEAVESWKLLDLNVWYM